MKVKRTWIILSLVVILGLLASCQGSPAQAPTPTPSTQAPAATSKPPGTAASTPTATTAPTATTKPATSPTVKKPEGTLIIGVDSLLTEKWLPHQGSGIQQSLISGVYDTLIGGEIPSGDPVVPQIAEKWEVSADGLSWTFYLRKGIQFHDNWGELTAEDVKFSLELLTRSDSASSAKGVLTQYISKITVVNPYQLVISTKTPFVNLDYYMSSTPTYAGITSKKYVESVGEPAAQAHPIGSGPYKFAEHKAGTFVRLEALPTHWRKTGEYQTVINTVVPEQSTRLAMLKNGEIDIAQIDTNYKKEAQAIGVELRTQPLAREVFVALGGQLLTTRKTYDANVPWVGPTPERALKVRQALNLAVDKKAIINSLLQGEGEELAIPGFFDGQPWAEPNWKPYPYDPAKAKQLLIEAGYPDGFAITMRPTPFPGVPITVELAEAVAMYWEKIGLKVKREPIEYSVDRAQLVAREIPPGVTWARALTPRPEPIMNTSARTTDSLMYMVESQYVDGLFNKAGGEPDFEKRGQIYQELGSFYYDGYYTVPIASMNSLFGVSKKVGELAQVSRLGYLIHMEYITRR